MPYMAAVVDARLPKAAAPHTEAVKLAPLKLEAGWQRKGDRHSFIAPPVPYPLHMPRNARAALGGICYHVINRGNGRQRVFRKDEGYRSFLTALDDASLEIPMRVLGYCLLPNHFHLVVWPEHDGDMSRWMHWAQNAHVRRYHQYYNSSGHIWQGRFKSFPIQQDEHLLTVLRYVERNPVRAELVERAEQWIWSSSHHWAGSSARPAFLIPGPVRRP